MNSERTLVEIKINRESICTPLFIEKSCKNKVTCRIDLIKLPHKMNDCRAIVRTPLDAHKNTELRSQEYWLLCLACFLRCKYVI